MSKHSPGPWRYPHTVHSPARLVAADGDCIAMVYLTNPSTRKRDDAHARNAAMLRATPELLAFVTRCADLRNDIDGGMHNLGMQAGELLKRLRLEP